MPGACEFLLNRVVHLRSLHGRSTTRRANGLPSSPAATVARVPGRRIALALLAIPLAGCGNPVHSHYSVKQTAPCLRKLGYKVSTNAEKLGPVEASATEGALRAKEKGNALVVTFSENSSEAKNIEDAYKRFSPKPRAKHINDVMSMQHNVVLLWTITPPKDELDRVTGCLR